MGVTGTQLLVVVGMVLLNTGTSIGTCTFLQDITLLYHYNSGRCIRTLLSHSVPTVINDIDRDDMYLVIGIDNYTVQVLSFYSRTKIPVIAGTKRLERRLAGTRISTAIDYKRGCDRTSGSRRIKSCKL